MLIIDLKNEYFEWLCSKVYVDPEQIRFYNKVLSQLYDTHFYTVLTMDDNRAVDGVDLRYRFGYENSFSDDTLRCSNIINKKCNVLEMMVALSIKGDEQIMQESNDNSKASFIFMTMMNNSGLSNFDNNYYDSQSVELILYKILNREYDYYGHGGFFVVNNPRWDMRTIDIWYQMNWFIEYELYNK